MPPTFPALHRARPGDRITREHNNFAFLGWIAANCIGVNAIVYAVTEWMRRSSRLPHWLIDSNLYELSRFLHLIQGHDSWAPMLTATHFWQSHPGSNIYQAIFFSEHVKFQYPLTSLLPFVLMSHFGLSDAQVSTLLGGIGWASVVATAILCIVIASHSAASKDFPAIRLDTVTTVAIILGSLLFYPLLKGCVIGQIQTELTLTYTAAFYCWLRGKERAAGALLGIMVLCKPQFLLVLVWAALRNRWSAVFAGLACIALFLPVALIVFGWQNNLGYLSVLSALSHTGESFFQNHSVNGILNRLLFNGGDQMFHMDRFPPFNPIVYTGTLISSIALIAIAFVFPHGRARRGGMADFACITAVATMASPIAWQHHYGVFLPVLVWLWFGRSSGRAPVRGVTWLVIAYVLISDCLSPLNLLYGIPLLNIAQSHMFFGGLIVLWILLSPNYATRNEIGTDSGAAKSKLAGAELHLATATNAQGPSILISA
jgi:alpha-1,2-mannosyltransferase